MAIYHLSVKNISRSSGRSSVAAAAYRAGENLHDERQGITHDYTKKSGVDSSFILTPDHCQREFTRYELWNEVEQVSNRSNSRLAREIDLAIPVEITDNQLKRELVLDYVRDNFTSDGMIADVAFHDLNSHNPHAHIMLTTREVSNDGVLNPKAATPLARSWNKKENVEHWRQQWDVAANKKLEQVNSESRIDHRSNADRGIEFVPQIHLGTKAHGVVKDRKAGKPRNVPESVRPRLDRYNKIEDINSNIRQLAATQAEIRELQAQKAAFDTAQKHSETLKTEALRRFEQVKAGNKYAETKSVDSNLEQWSKYNYLPLVDANGRLDEAQGACQRLKNQINHIETDHSRKSVWQRWKTRKTYKAELAELKHDLSSYQEASDRALTDAKKIFSGLDDNPEAKKQHQSAMTDERQIQSMVNDHQSEYKRTQELEKQKRAELHEKLKNAPKEPQRGSGRPKYSGPSMS